MLDRPIRVARIIGRLNVGGPAVQALHLTKLLDERGFQTLLLRGQESPREGSMDYLAEELDVRPVRVPSMRRDVGPADLPALAQIVRELRRYRPEVVHTEAAKAGTLGRLAALAAPGSPVVLHTFHGHSLEGYFSPARARLFLGIERLLASTTALLIAVSEEVKQDLVRLGVAAPDRIRVIPLGLDLARFALDERERAAKRDMQRQRWGVPPDALLVTLVARLAPIKRVDRFLRIATLLAREHPGMRFVVVGDGELHDELRASSAAQGLRDQLHWAGFERDMPAVCCASDCVVLTSDNEGTPVSLIEAHAAGLPAVSTRVGGAASVVLDGQTGRLVAPDDDAGFAAAVWECLARAGEFGEVGRSHVLSSFSLERLATDLSDLYRSLLASRQGARRRRATASS